MSAPPTPQHPTAPQPLPAHNAGHPALDPHSQPTLTPERERQLLDLHRAALADGSPRRELLHQLLLPLTDQLHATILRVLAGGGPISDAHRHAADDLTHDALVRVIGSLHTFDGASRLATWATRIAINAALTHRRRERLRAHQSLSSTEHTAHNPSHTPHDSDSVSPADHPAELAGPPRVSSDETTDDRAPAVARALLTLPTDQQEVLLLRDARGLDYQHIALALGISLGTVKSRLFRARAALRAALTSHTP